MTNGAVLVVLPTYDEAQNIEGILDRTRAAVPRAHILVVDDGSPDGTGELADKVAFRDEAVHVLHRSAKEGLGAAYLAGFAWGLQREYGVVVEMDADGSHQPEQLPELLAALDHADLVIGSRWVPGGKVVNWPLRRKVLSRSANTYARLAMGLPLQDATGGFRAYRRSTLAGIDLGAVRSQGYCFQVDLARRALDRGFRVTEVPISFVQREYGVSKMSGAVVREALVNVTKWGAQQRARQLTELARSRRRR